VWPPPCLPLHPPRLWKKSSCQAWWLPVRWLPQCLQLSHQWGQLSPGPGGLRLIGLPAASWVLSVPGAFWVGGALVRFGRSRL
jgi:hypothetical protein